MTVLMGTMTILHGIWGTWFSDKTISGWWFGCHQFYFPIHIGLRKNHPNWRTPSFFRGVAFKPPTRLFTWQNTWLAINHDISTNSWFLMEQLPGPCFPFESLIRVDTSSLKPSKFDGKVNGKVMLNSCEERSVQVPEKEVLLPCQVMGHCNSLLQCILLVHCFAHGP